MKKRRNTSKNLKKLCLSKKKERAKEQILVTDKDHTKTHQVPIKKFLLFHTIKGTQVIGCTPKGRVVMPSSIIFILLSQKYLTFT
jgi:hypothetical protein